MTSRPLRRSVLPVAALAALLLTAPASHAGDPVSSAFRKAAKTAEKAVKSASVGEVGDAKAALAARLKAHLDGDDDLPTAVAGAVQAVTTAIARSNTVAFQQAHDLADAGADLLVGYAGPLPDDLRDGAGGAWDEFKRRVEAQLGKNDAKLAKLFAAFMQGVVKQAGKDGFDPDPRWRVNGHADLLGGVEGPYLAFLDAPVQLADINPLVSQLAVEVRYLTAEGDFLQDVGIDFRGLGNPTVEVTEGDGSTVMSDALTPDVNGVIGATMSLTRTTPHPLLTELLGDDDSVLDARIGSVPGNGGTPKDVLKQWNKRLKQELAFAGKIIGQITNETKQQLAALLKENKQGGLGTDEALEAAIGQMRAALANDCFWLPLALGNPGNNAAAELMNQGLGDESVDAELNPDGQGAYTAGLEKLSGKVARQDAKRAKILEQFGVKLGKQNKDVGIVLDVVPSVRPDQRGIQMDIAGQDFEIETSPGPVLSGLAQIPGETNPFLMLSAGLAKLGLANTVLELSELPSGQTVALGGLIQESQGTTETKVPLLGDLPVAGWLFKTEAANHSRPNLLIFVTPRILADDPK